MASHSVPVPYRRTSQHALARTAARFPSLRTVAIVFVILLILFRWLHLILALEMAATAIQVQSITEDIQRQERMNALLRREIAKAQSPRRLAVRAERLGYELGEPVYIPLDQPIGQAPGGSSPTALETVREKAPPGAINPAVEALSSLFDTTVELEHSP